MPTYGSCPTASYLSGTAFVFCGIGKIGKAPASESLISSMSSAFSHHAPSANNLPDAAADLFASERRIVERRVVGEAPPLCRGILRIPE